MIRVMTFVMLLSGGMAVAQTPEAFLAMAWPQTDFSRHSVALAEIQSGGPPKDGIPAIDAPTFIMASDETRLSDTEPVLSLAMGGEVKAWPIRYLMWHEIVNDTLGGTPVAVTFCPLCNTGMVFDRRLNGETLSFGVSGLLRNSDMVMYDRQSESWWQQALGEGIVGLHMGAQLAQLPAIMESWGEYRARSPQGLVMDQPAYRRAYGSNPYGGYDSLARPFLYDGENPPFGIHPLARVVRVGNRAWPLKRLRGAGIITEKGVTLVWSGGQVSALDARDIAAGKEVGTVRVTDAQGHDIAYDMPFAFAFHAFHPDGEWMLGR